MVYSVAGAAAAVLPSNVPPGRAMLTLTYNGPSTPSSQSRGFGPGIFTAIDGSVKTFAVPAKSGDVVTAWATGLGPISRA